MSDQQLSVTFVLADGTEQHVQVSSGETLMDAALDNGVPGIIAQCGGGCTCCTCHCWVQQPWLQQLPEPHQDEVDMLEYAWGLAVGSRLACQVVVTPRLNGIRVCVPAQQS
ncbi:MAG: 2Fe-2S iron-sulfur cluster-binding protein [Pseudomonadota bacterium]